MFATLKRSVTVQAMVAAVLMSMIGSDARADEPIDVARDCVRAVRAIASNTGGDIGDIRSRAIRGIRALDDDDAPDREIVSAGNDGRQRINTRARAGVQRVRTVVDACVATLADLDAPRWMVARVIDTGANSAQRINMQRDRATTTVARAVRAAIAD